MNTITQTKTQELGKLITDGIECWVKAGELIVDLLDNDQSTLPEMSDVTGLPTKMLARFEQLGRKQLMPDLLIADYPASGPLTKLSYSEQKRLVDGSVEVLLPNNDDTLLIATKNLTVHQCRQVFSGSHVRSIAGQRAWIESRRTKRNINVVETEAPYTIVKGAVVFNKDVKLTTCEVANILTRLTSK